MCGEFCDIPAVWVKLSPVISSFQVELREDCSSIQLVDDVVHGASDVTFTLYTFSLCLHPLAPVVLMMGKTHGIGPSLSP